MNNELQATFLAARELAAVGDKEMYDHVKLLYQALHRASTAACKLCWAVAAVRVIERRRNEPGATA